MCKNIAFLNIFLEFSLIEKKKLRTINVNSTIEFFIPHFPNNTSVKKIFK